jgi:uncharacterized protein (DUF302 family)
MTNGELRKRVPLPYAATVEQTKAALGHEGFGVLTEIDVTATLREKLGVEFRDYVILGACNPPLALRALQADLEVGTLLPCNVAIYADGAETVICAFDPQLGMKLTDADALKAVAQEAKDRLSRALDLVN